MRLRRLLYEATAKHVCHEPPFPFGCEAKHSAHRCVFAPTDHLFHKCNCGYEFSKESK